MIRLLSLFLFVSFYSSAQDLQVEYDKKKDFSHYKTFRIGDSEIITPKDQVKKSDGSLQKLIIQEVTEELIEKGLKLSQDSVADLVVSFVVGSAARTDMQQLGPLGMTPGSDATTWSRDFIIENLIIDLNDRNNNLVWRVTSTSSSGMSDSKTMVDAIVSAGFKKLSLKAKKEKKK